MAHSVCYGQECFDGFIALGTNNSTSAVHSATRRYLDFSSFHIFGRYSYSAFNQSATTGLHILHHELGIGGVSCSHLALDRLSSF